MIDANIGPEYAELGQMVVDDVGQSGKNPLLYAEVSDGTAACSIFYIQNSKIVYQECTFETVEKVYNIWEMTKLPDRWSGIKYRVDGTKFGVEMIFANEFSKDEFYFDRSYRVAKETFGNLEFDYSKAPVISKS